MPNFQQTLFLGDEGGTYGWSEPYYATYVDIDAAKIGLDALCTARAEVLTDLHQVVAGRVSDVDVLNDSLLAEDLPIDGAIAATSVTAVDPWTALMVRIESTSAHRGRHFFHGVLEDTFLPNRSYDPANPNNAAWVTWMTYLIDNTLLRYKLAGVPVYGVVTNAILQREVEKKVGRPFNLLRGRRAI
jgi:hypothetical protein